MNKKIVIYNFLFFAWVILLALIGSAKGDLFLPGKSRVFSGVSNSIAAFSICLYFYYLFKNRDYRKAVYWSSGFWLSIIVFFFSPVILALFFKPPYGQIEAQARKMGMDESNIYKLVNGPAISAASEYTKWVYGWETYFIFQVKSS